MATEHRLLWQEPSCDSIVCKQQYAPCTCELGKFPTDDYPAFLAKRGIDAKEFAADVAAVNEHVRRAIAVSFRLRDIRLAPVVLGLVAVIAWAAGAQGRSPLVSGLAPWPSATQSPSAGIVGASSNKRWKRRCSASCRSTRR